MDIILQDKDMKNIIRKLALHNPVQGIAGATIALTEAVSGNMQSIRKRFEISVSTLFDIKEVVLTRPLI